MKKTKSNVDLASIKEVAIGNGSIEIVEKLISVLARHDWYYSRSDDGSVYRKGEAEWREICWLMKRMEGVGMGGEAAALYHHYSR